MEEEVFEACEVKVGGDLQRIVLHESPLQNIGSILPEHEHLVLGDREEGLDVRMEHGAAVAVQLGRELGFDLALTGASLKRGGGDLGQRIDSIRPPQEGANLAHQVAHALPYNTTFRSHSSHSPHTEAQQH